MMKKIALLLAFLNAPAFGAQPILPPCEVDGIQVTYWMTAPYAYYTSQSPAVTKLINGTPKIFFNSMAMTVYPEEISDHMAYHECAHVTLRHVFIDSTTLTPEQLKEDELAADCEGARRLVKERSYDEARLRKLVQYTELGSPANDPVHGTGKERAQAILSCGLEALNTK